MTDGALFQTQSKENHSVKKWVLENEEYALMGIGGQNYCSGVFF